MITEEEYFKQKIDYFTDDKCRIEIDKNYKPDYKYKIANKEIFNIRILDMNLLQSFFPGVRYKVLFELFVLVDVLDDDGKSKGFTEFIFHLKEDFNE